MHLFEAISSRRSIKEFDPNHKLGGDEERQLFELAMQSPTAFNIQHWRFVLVKDPALRKQIRAAAWDQSQVTDASLLVILCGDLMAWNRSPERYWSKAPQPVRDFLLPAIAQYYSGNELVQRDEVMRSCGLAGMTLMLAARAMGYESCPMDGFDFEAVGRLIRLPEDHVISFMVAIGKGTKAPWPKPGQIGLDEALVEDGFA